jgi:DNA invertase Pin-like site-specific DNA recombinase
MASTRRAALYVRVSTSDRGQTIENQLQPLQEAARRLGWTVVAVYGTRALVAPRGAKGELRAREIDLYLHQQALDTSTPSGRMLFGMLSVFSEFERAMIRDRVRAGLDRARSSGKRLGRPPMAPIKIDRIRRALDEGRGIRATARLLKVSGAKVSEISRMMMSGTMALGS